MPDSLAAALATARLTPRIALAPRLLLLGVPSRLIIARSIIACSVTAAPCSSLFSVSFTFSTAFITPLPM